LTCEPRIKPVVVITSGGFTLTGIVLTNKVFSVSTAEFSVLPPVPEHLVPLVLGLVSALLDLVLVFLEDVPEDVAELLVLAVVPSSLVLATLAVEPLVEAEEAPVLAGMLEVEEIDNFLLASRQLAVSEALVEPLVEALAVGRVPVPGVVAAALFEIVNVTICAGGGGIVVVSLLEIPEGVEAVLAADCSGEVEGVAEARVDRSVDRNVSGDGGAVGAGRVHCLVEGEAAGGVAGSLQGAVVVIGNILAVAVHPRRDVGIGTCLAAVPVVLTSTVAQETANANENVSANLRSRGSAPVSSVVVGSPFLLEVFPRYIAVGASIVSTIGTGSISRS